MKQYGYRWVHKDLMSEDSWTYGEWRQYICRLDGFTQCGRLSALPFFMAALGFMLMFAFLVGLFVAFHYGSDAVAWGRAIGFGAVSVLFFVPWWVECDSGYRLVHMVGPPNVGDRRVMPGEEDK